MRVRTPDLLKGIAVILMIQVHLLELFATQEIYDSLIGKWLLFLGGPPAAPVFMAVMGYFIGFSKKSLFSDVKRGLKLIVWGMALNIGLNINLFYHIYTGVFQISPLEYLFGVDIFFLAGLSIIIIGMIRHFFPNKIWPYLAALLVALLIPIINAPASIGLSSYLWAYVYADSWWSYFPIVPWIAYVLVGVLFNLIEKNLMTLYRKYSWLIITGSFIILAFTFKYGLDVSSNLHQYYHHGALFFSFTLVFMVFWSAVVHQFSLAVNNPITKYIEWLGKNVTTVYVFQWLIIGNLATLLYKTQFGFSLIGWFVLVLSVSSLASLIWHRIRLKPRKTATI